MSQILRKLGIFLIMGKYTYKVIIVLHKLLRKGSLKMWKGMKSWDGDIPKGIVNGVMDEFVL